MSRLPTSDVTENQVQSGLDTDFSVWWHRTPTHPSYLLFLTDGEQGWQLLRTHSKLVPSTHEASRGRTHSFGVCFTCPTAEGTQKDAHPGFSTLESLDSLGLPVNGHADSREDWNRACALPETSFFHRVCHISTVPVGQSSVIGSQDI